MTTLKLKKPAVPKAAGEHRAPLRGSGAKRPRPTLAEAQAERARRLEEEKAAQAPQRETARAPFPRRDEPRAEGHRGRTGTPPTATAPRERPQRNEERREDRPASQGDPARTHGRRDASRAPQRSAPQGEQRGRGPAASPRGERRPPSAPGGRAVPAQRRAPRPETAPAPASAAVADALPRLSKRMSELGLASRREADEWIEQGFVRVDGVVVDELGARVALEQAITIDPQARLEQAKRVTVLLHKPLGYVSGQAEDGHEPAFTLINAASRWKGDASPQRFNASQLKHLVPAGRLDLDSSGLLVLTQDGRVAKQLIGENSKVEKEYVVRVAWSAQPELVALHTAFPPELLQRLRVGLNLDGMALKPAQVSWQNEQHLRIVLREGRKRQIRRMCELVGLQVLSLKRIRIGRIGLGELPAGQWRYLAGYESFV
ncbi:MAG: pseudouridine synthase [Methylibium sp.]|nr:pseudouridine synthase [Methylibium sp.]